ncbi:DUF2490 domain-containing protein [Fulvivirga aurantia]|uniref:DUF2490 domain-containing protein n=1 Tax=Fulvivirga aurantia TaxID=2529383 RepID=UPI00162910F8|nr:DUF2490 domain-containing protein [Fulvivirga aurantia]
MAHNIASLAQNRETQFVWEAETAADYKISSSWSTNTSIGKRSIWYSEENSSLSGELRFIEVNQFATYKVNIDTKVSFGYKYRKTEPFESTDEREHRTTQQISTTHYDRALRLASRLRTEQRFRNDSFEHRYRYRIAGDLPLSGQELNTREFYVTVTEEILLSYESGDHAWDNRLGVVLGYTLRKAKVQFGITYRLEDLNRNTNDFVFISTGAYLSLN